MAAGQQQQQQAHTGQMSVHIESLHIRRAYVKES
jgi:hypothetical protein